MNEFQIIYASVLLSLGLVRWREPAWYVLTAGLVATLYACHMMDIGAITAREAVTWYIVIDTATGMVIALHSGYAKVIACGFVITIPMYSLPIALDVQNSTTFAIVYPIAALQLGVLIFGPSGTGGRFIRLAFDYVGGGIGSGLAGRQVSVG